MVITKEDINYISQKTNLSVRKTKTLTEEQRDLDLVINELSANEISQKELLVLSFPVIARYIIFRFSHKYSYDISEKSYVCDLITKHFPLASRNKIPRPFPKEKENQDFAEYSLILVGFFSHRLKPDIYKKYRDYAYNYFKYYQETEDFGRHLEVWLEIFARMRKEEIFS